MTRIALAALLAALVGCAPVAPYSECGRDTGTVCPEGTYCQSVSADHAICTVICERLSDECEHGGECYRASNPYIYVCRLPCNFDPCPNGLTCALDTERDGISEWCM